MGQVHPLVVVADTGAGIDPANLTRVFLGPFFTTKPRARARAQGLACPRHRQGSPGLHLSGRRTRSGHRGADLLAGRRRPSPPRRAAPPPPAGSGDASSLASGCSWLTTRPSTASSSAACCAPPRPRHPSSSRRAASHPGVSGSRRDRRLHHPGHQHAGQIGRSRLAEIREDRADVPVVVLGGYGEDATILPDASAQVQGFLHKPVDAGAPPADRDHPESGSPETGSGGQQPEARRGA